MNFEEIKEIADRYGIVVRKVKKDRGGFIVDKSGKIEKNLPRDLIDGFLGIDDSGFIGVGTLLRNQTYSNPSKNDLLAA